MEAEKGTNVRVLDRALDVLECFSESTRELGLMEFVEKTGLSASTVHRIIKTLEQREYLLRNEETKHYSLGFRIARLGSLAGCKAEDGLREIAYAYLVAVRDKCNESVSLYIRDGLSRVCIERVESRQLLRRVITVGERLPLASGATGKVLLSDLDDVELQELVGDQSAGLKLDLDKVRARGYWISSGERELGLSAIAAPVYNAGGRIVASVSISGPTARLIDEDLAERIQLIVDCGKKISQQMGYYK